MRQVLARAMAALTLGFLSLAVPAPAAWAATAIAPQKNMAPIKGEFKRDLGLGQGCADADKVQATDLTLSPAQPRAGQAVTVSLTIKSLCTTGNLNIPWRIETGTGGSANDVLGSGTQQNVAPGATFTVTAPWTAVAGQRGFLGTADPQNTLRENNQHRANNLKDLGLTVPQVSADTAGQGGAPPRLVTQTLEWRKAKNAGASFPASFDGIAVGCLTDTLENTQIAGGGPDQFAFSFSCNVLGIGGRGNFEAYANFTLKNNWHVKRYDVVETRKDPGTNWRWDSTPPAAGATSPYVRFHMYTGASGGNVIVGVKVTIEGPAGTDPYQ